jgi:hypothetical protein
MDSIFYHCHYGNIERVQELINQGFDINQRDSTRTGQTSLYIAAKYC